MINLILLILQCKLINCFFQDFSTGSEVSSDLSDVDPQVVIDSLKVCRVFVVFVLLCKAVLWQKTDCVYNMFPYEHMTHLTS